MKKASEKNYHTALYFNRKKPLRTFYHFFDHEQKNMGLAMLCFLFKHSPVWILPLVTGNVINALTNAVTNPGNSGSYIHTIILNLVILSVLIFQNIPTHTLFIYLLAKSVRQIEALLRLSIVRRIQEMSISFHDRVNSGAIQSKVLRDVESVRNLIMLGMNALLPAFVSFIFAFTVTLTKQPFIALVYPIAIPIAIGLMVLFRGKMRETNSILRQDMEKMTEDVTEMIEMIPVTKAHGLEETQIKKLEEKFDFVRTHGLRLDTVSAAFGAMNWVAFQFLQVLCLAFTVPFALSGKIGVGDVVLFQGLFNSVLGAVATILNVYPDISRGVEAINSIGDILESSDIEENEGKKIISEISGKISFGQVTFSYPEITSHAIKSFDLEIASGESVAFVGESGSGKSTIMQLVMGLRQPNSGIVRVDGIDLTTVDRRSFRQHISVVPQNVILFSGTVRENISYGLSSVSETKILRAIEMANAREFIEKLPRGLDTAIGEKGSRLSGGQRQRIAIARALIRNPQILIFDEATSALDVASEKLVQEAIDAVRKDRTTLIVAHRLSTIKNVDTVVVLGQGMILEKGPYAELSSRGGEFSRLKSLQ
ncbi:MAG TPA: ABC transporter ATP-binding protein [Treponemataceae bacterium]|nr:ABC transporter ATP-binding protein [Treponemataceae bacterium]